MPLIFSKGSSRSTLKHTRAYYRLVATRSYARFSSLLQISSCSWSAKGFMMYMGLPRSVEPSSLPSARVVDMFAFFPGKVDKKVCWCECGHKLAWAWLSRLHMSKICSGYRSKWRGWLALRRGRFYASSLPKGPTKPSRDDPSGNWTTRLRKNGQSHLRCR
jgi:hypothetical protein